MRALVLLAVMAGCSGTPQPESPAPAAPAPVTTNAAAIEKARADSIRYPYTTADVHFMTMMIGHHGQAVQAARWALTHDADAAVVRLAERIINAQQDQITIMQQWLLDRQKPVPGIDAGAHTHMQMPGMLTEAELAQLNAARGAEFDRLFLTLMIRHHRGAVTMVKELFATTGAARDLLVFKFANDVQVDQTTEVARMEQMLATLTSQPRNQQ